MTATTRRLGRESLERKGGLTPLFHLERRPLGSEAGFVDSRSHGIALPFPRPPRKGPENKVECAECGTKHRVPRDAASTNCPSCGVYISLRDIEIRGQRTGEIRTQGKVVVHRGAVVIGSIFARDVIIHGRTLGRVHASADARFHHNGRPLGELECGRLHVSRGAKIEFVSPVHAGEARIEGTVEGEINCHGEFRLARKGAMRGALRTASFRSEKGCSFEGTIQILHGPARLAKSIGGA